MRDAFLFASPLTPDDIPCHLSYDSFLDCIPSGWLLVCNWSGASRTTPSIGPSNGEASLIVTGS